MAGESIAAVEQADHTDGSAARTLQRLRDLEDILCSGPVVAFLWRVSDDWPVEYVSRSVEQFGYTAQQLMSGEVSWPAITHPEDDARLQREVAEVFERGADEFTNKYRLITKSGDIRWLEDRNVVIRNAAGEPTHVRGIALDVTERKRAELERQKAQWKLLHVREEGQRTREAEMRRLAGRIHDDFGQLLTSLTMDLHWIRRRLPGGDGEVVEHIDRDLETINEMLNLARSISMDIHPSILEHLGLAAAIEWRADQLAQKQGIELDMELDEDVPLSEEQARTVFRIARELLTNIARHAKANCVRIRLKHTDGEARLTVSDDGIGMPYPPEERFASFGLLSVRDSVAEMGGAFDITSGPAQGTTIAVRVPLSSGPAGWEAP